MTYFNTTNEPENQVKLFTKINSGQDTNCLEIIREHFSDTPFTTHTVYLKYLHRHFRHPVLESSIRRSIDSLKRAGEVKETGNMVMGGHGRRIIEYRL